MRNTRQPAGFIDASHLYHAAEIRRRLRIGDNAWRELRRQLPSVTVGRSTLILGSDVIEFCKREKTKQGNPQRMSHDADAGDALGQAPNSD